MFFRRLVSAALLLLAGACSMTTQEMRASSGETGSIRVARPFQEVFSNYYSNLLRCYRGGDNVSNFHAESTELRKGELARIEVIQDGISRRVIISSDLKAVPDGVELTYYIHPWFARFREYRPALTRWAHGPAPDCSLSASSTELDGSAALGRAAMMALPGHNTPVNHPS